MNLVSIVPLSVMSATIELFTTCTKSCFCLYGLGVSVGGSKIGSVAVGTAVLDTVVGIEVFVGAIVEMLVAVMIGIAVGKTGMGCSKVTMAKVVGVFSKVGCEVETGISVAIIAVALGKAVA